MLSRTTSRRSNDSSRSTPATSRPPTRASSARRGPAVTTRGRRRSPRAETRLDEAKRELAAALGGFEGARLSELVAEAARRVKEIDDAERAREENTKARLSTEEELAARTAATARDEEALADVRRKLAELVAPLAVADDASAEEIARALKETRELFGAVDERAHADASLRAVEAEIAAFEADVAALAKTAG